MARINTNIASMQALRSMRDASTSVQTSLQRLATGNRINAGKDDPAGLIASEYLRSEMKQTEVQIANAQRAGQMLSTADGAMGEVSNLLISLQGLMGQMANVAGRSQEEQDADQLQVDAILSSINRIGNVTAFEGIRLLDGEKGFTTSGVSSAALGGLEIGRSLKGPMPVAVETIASAWRGEIDLTNAGTGLSQATRLEIRGNTGTVALNFASATRSSAIAASINEVADETGVTATLSADGTSVRLMSSAYGAMQFVSVVASTSAVGLVDRQGNATNIDHGRDATVAVGGSVVAAQGLDVTARTGSIEARFQLNDAMNVAGATTSFGVTGGGASFGIDLPGNEADTPGIGLPKIQTLNLGRVATEGKVYTLNDLSSARGNPLTGTDAGTAQKVVQAAVADVARYRGQIGAFQRNELESTINALQIKLENLSSGQSAIRDTDYATETSELARAQIRYQMSTTALAMANQQPQTVLKLLGG